MNRDQSYRKFVSFIRGHSGQQCIYNDGHAHEIHTSNRKPLPVSPESQFCGTRLVHCFEGDPGLYDPEESFGKHVKLVGEWHAAASRGTPLALVFHAAQRSPLQQQRKRIAATPQQSRRCGIPNAKFLANTIILLCYLRK